MQQRGFSETAEGPRQGLICFDRFTIDLDRGSLRQDGKEIWLRPKSLAVLCYLAENAGRLILKEEIFAALWPDAAVTDDSLVQCIGEVRRALGNDCRRIVQTIPRRGYLFNTAVSCSEIKWEPTSTAVAAPRPRPALAYIGRARVSRFTSRPSTGGCMREVIPTPIPGLDLRREYGHHQSPAIRAGGMVFCSGMVAIDPQSGERQHGTVTSEARRIFENLKLLLESTGLSLDRLVQVHAMIYDRIEYDVLNRLYRRYVPNAPPARTVMSVQIEAGFKVMLDVIAAAEARQPAAMIYPRQVIEPGGWRRPGLPHSRAVRAGEFVFLSGMTATDPTTGTPARGTVAAETRRILTNLGELLEAAGSSLAKVVKVNALIYSMLEYENMNSVYREFFPVDPPARTVCGAGLIGGHKVEIECVALA